MDINIYRSFEETMEKRYSATEEEIQTLLELVPNISEHWSLKAIEKLAIIDLALYFGIPFEDIVTSPNFFTTKPRDMFAKCKLAILANPDLENFGITTEYLNSNLHLQEIACTMKAILAGDLPHGYDIFEDAFKTSQLLNMSFFGFIRKYRSNSHHAFISQQFKTYFPEFNEELMQEFPFFYGVHQRVNYSKKVNMPGAIKSSKHAPSQAEIERKRAFKEKIKALWAEPSKPKPKKIVLPTTSIDDICYTTDKNLYYEILKKKTDYSSENTESDEKYC